MTERDELRILRRREVEKKVGLKRSTIYLYLQQGIFPRPVKLGPRTVGWIETEIDGWLATKASDRPAGKSRE